MISSLTNQGTLRFMVYDGALDTAVFLRSLCRQIGNAPRKLVLIIDNMLRGERAVRHGRVTATGCAGRRRSRC